MVIFLFNILNVLQLSTIYELRISKSNVTLSTVRSFYFENEITGRKYSKIIGRLENDLTALQMIYSDDRCAKFIDFLFMWGAFDKTRILGHNFFVL